MPKVSLLHERESFDSLFKRWKRSVDRNRTLQELRKREYFEKPSLKRKRLKAIAKKRAERQMQMHEENMRQLREEHNRLKR